MLGAGLAIGWLAGPARRGASEPESASASTTIVAPSAEIERLRTERDRLEAENDDLVAQLTSLLDQQAQWVESAVIPEEPAPQQAALAPQDPGERRRGPDWDSEEMRARREEFMRENAERMREFEERLAAQLTDPAAIERFNALMEWREYQQELAGEYRRAQTDAERESIRAKMDEVRQTSRQMVRDQQDKMLRDLAAANGISDPAKQAAFVSGMKQALDNPFFTMEGMFTGGGGPGRGGFPGGGRRGGRPSGEFRSESQN